MDLPLGKKHNVKLNDSIMEKKNPGVEVLPGDTAPVEFFLLLLLSFSVNLA